MASKTPRVTKASVTVSTQKRYTDMQDLVEEHCNVTMQWGVYFGWGDDPTKEVLKACTFLTKEDVQNHTGQLAVFFKTEAEARAAFDTAVGDDGPTKSNPYKGDVRVFAYLVGPDGKGRSENT